LLALPLLDELQNQALTYRFGEQCQSVSQSVMFIYKAHLKTTAVGQSAVQCINNIKRT